MDTRTKQACLSFDSAQDEVRDSAQHEVSCARSAGNDLSPRSARKRLVTWPLKITTDFIIRT